MEDNFEEQQVAAVKDWWKKYWKSIVSGLVAGALLVSGYNGWRDYRNGQAEEASMLYEQFSVFANTAQVAQMQSVGQQLIDDYSSTPYAELAALMLAKQAYEAGNVDDTIKYLTWAMDNAHVEEVEHVARTRLARVLNEKGDGAAALKLIDGVDAGPYNPWYLEIKGDIYVAQGDLNAARKAYSEAVALKGLKNDARTLQMKLDNLGVAGEDHE